MNDQVQVRVVEKNSGPLDGTKFVMLMLPITNADQTVSVLLSPVMARKIAGGLTQAADVVASYDPRRDRESPWRRLWRWVRGWW